jgi:transposase
MPRNRRTRCGPLPSDSPDFMPVESLWRWLREEVTYNFCHSSKEHLIADVAVFTERIKRDPIEVAGRLWVPDHLDPEREKRRLSR